MVELSCQSADDLKQHLVDPQVEQKGSLPQIHPADLLLKQRLLVA